MIEVVDGEIAPVDLVAGMVLVTKVFHSELESLENDGDGCFALVGNPRKQLVMLKDRICMPRKSMH